MDSPHDPDPGRDVDAPPRPGGEPVPGAYGGDPADGESKDRGAFTRYRVMAFITGGFLLLLCLEMFLKYALRLSGSEADGSAAPVMGDWIALVHGWIYVVYLASVAELWLKMRWGFGRLVALILGGVVPVLSFVMERNAQFWVEETIAARLGKTPTA